MDGKIFAGIDPGKTGGLGIVDQSGRYIAAWRWSTKDPIYLYNKLLLFKDMVSIAYLELIQVFPQKGQGFISQGQSTLVNFGTWQGFLIAAGIPYLTVSPLSWQAAQGLGQWSSKREHNPAQQSPLTLARIFWPTAPLDHQADDGKAVALLLAHLAAKDHYQGIGRQAIQAEAAAKNLKRKKAAREARKAAKAHHKGANEPW